MNHDLMVLCLCASLAWDQLVLGLVFTALHEMQTRSSDENSVCLSVHLSVRPSVRPSVTRVIPDKTVERSVQIYIPYERTFILVF